MNAKPHIIATALAIAAAISPVYADSDNLKLEALTRQIEALQARVSALESLATFTSLMPDFAERFHVMHRAGEAGDWAVASHELAEMQRMATLSQSIDVEKGKLMKSMMEPSLEALGDAIEHGNGEKFETALTQAINTCNACHAATGSGFIEVSLEVPDLLSLRHPHKLTPRAVPEGHSHNLPAGTNEMMHDSEPSGHGHDDAGKPKHRH
jgi:hypothetical protein